MINPKWIFAILLAAALVGALLFSLAQRAVRKANQIRRTSEAKRMSQELVATLSTYCDNDPEMMIDELLDLLAVKVLEGGMDNIDGVQMLERVEHDVASARKISAEARRRMEERLAAKPNESGCA